MLDPTARELLVRPQGAQRFELKIHAVTLENIEPNGDRYVVEQLATNEMMELGSLIAYTPADPNARPGDPNADPTIEQRGVIVAVIVRAGNGHLLGLPDPAFMTKHPDGIEHIVREHADVPMFFGPGDVVFIDHNARGRALKVYGREGRIVGQIDVLGRLEGVKLKRVNDRWEQVEE